MSNETLTLDDDDETTSVALEGGPEPREAGVSDIDSKLTPDAPEGTDTTQVTDKELAEVGAHAEKIVRDLAREPGVRPEVKEVFDERAVERGEEAMQDYAAEKEKNPVEQLLSTIGRVEEKLRIQGLRDDADIVSKIPDRIKRTIAKLRKEKEEQEEAKNTRITASDFLSMGGTGVMIAGQIGETGGYCLERNGTFAWRFESDDKIGEYDDSDYEILNRCLSKDGAAIFYRALGVLRDDEEEIDIPKVVDRLKAARKPEGILLKREKVDPLEYTISIHTIIAGVDLSIIRRKHANTGTIERQSYLMLRRDFLAAGITEQ